MVGMKKTIPSLLTLSRFPLGLLATALIFTGHFSIAAVVYFLAEFTDYLDGKLARRWNAVTDFGKTADLLADKSLILLVLLTLYNFNIVAPAMFYVVCTREFLTSAFRLIAGKLGQPNFLKTSNWGRYTSVILREAVGFMVFLAGSSQDVFAAQWWPIAWNLTVMLAWVGVSTRIFFLFRYLWRDRREGFLLTKQLLSYVRRR